VNIDEVAANIGQVNEDIDEVGAALTRSTKNTSRSTTIQVRSQVAPGRNG